MHRQGTTVAQQRTKTGRFTHLYQADPQSGAGNCTCGRAERHRLHLHTYMPAADHPWLCTCALAEDAECHW